ncbi:MAG: hypothetical protein IKY14_03260, partial [Erysipelotrichaceae bacterium]|nr:hypothetical protein [Erysipelotrichaceae bacterium]
MNSKVLLQKAGIDCEIERDITHIVRYAQQADDQSIYVDVYEDSQEFIKQALNQGALVLTDKAIDGCIQVQHPRRVQTELVQILYDFPYRQMKLIGVSGTCGKSTVVHLLKDCLLNQGIGCCCVMTGKIVMNEKVIPTRNTTPDALFLIPLMRQCLDLGIHVMMMEVSSEAYVHYRTEGLYFDVLIGTMIASDHLDTHKTIESYHQVKKKILSLNKPKGVVIINGDDQCLSSWISELLGYVITYGTKKADFQISDVHIDLSGSSFNFMGQKIHTRLLSMANVYNLAAVLCAAFVLDCDMKKVFEWTNQAKGCPGRFEVIMQEPYVMVDYAHTQKAMAEVLAFLRKMSTKKIICVFGCGGNRDSSKRPMMGKTATTY